MLSIPEQHYNYLIQLVKSLHQNFSLLLNQKERFKLDMLEGQFMKLNNHMKRSMQKIINSQDQFKVILMQYEDENKILKLKGQKLTQQVKKKQQQISKLRIQLTKSQKQYSRLKQTCKTIKQQLNTKSRALEQTQQFYKSQLKSLKKQYKQESKHMKSRTKQLQNIIQTTLISNNNQQIQMELDKQLEELRKFQLNQQNQQV